MARLVLLRRREIWFPTWLGWLLLLAIGGAGLLVLAANLHAFLAPDEPVGARLLVVEGWLAPEDLDQAVEVFRSGGYEQVLTTGGPFPAGFEGLGFGSFAEFARDFLVRRGLPRDRVVAVPAPASAQDRTYLSGVQVREWASREGVPVEALDVFSSGVHGRRSRMLYREAFGSGVRVGIRSARPERYDPEAWWKTSAGSKAVLSEAISWLWTELFFRPAPPGSHEETWGVQRP